MQVAVLYICTGKYNQFFTGFYKSCEQNFLSGYRKQYFVWSDDINIADGCDNVVVIYKECVGFPADSLFRFDMFLQVENDLKTYDYIYFFNANSEIRLSIGEEILPDESGLVIVVWPGKREQHQI